MALAIDRNLEKTAGVVLGARDLTFLLSFGPGENAGRRIVVQHSSQLFLGQHWVFSGVFVSFTDADQLPMKNFMVHLKSSYDIYVLPYYGLVDNI